MDEFLTELNAALGILSALGNPKATCETGDNALNAKIAFDVDISVFSYDFGKFGLYMEVQPCADEPEFDFGVETAGADTQVCPAGLALTCDHVLTPSRPLA